MALLAAAHINAKRREDEPRHFDGRAFVIRQLKHPDEVLWLRYIYGPAFFLLGVYSPDDVRRVYLTEKMDENQANHLMQRDEGGRCGLGTATPQDFLPF